jgi:phosphatidylserine/phosphatidylglycerophosphate/cardiolipin synthase-like enzyme
MDTFSEIPIELLSSPWTAKFYELIKLAQKELLVASPFLSDAPLRKIVEIVRCKPSFTNVHIDILTNLAVDSLLSGSLDVAALLYLVQSIPNSTVTYLPSLHAKIYVADDKVAVVTSANLTTQGLEGNHEYGVLLRDPMLVSKVRIDLIKYAALGNKALK